MDGRLPVKHQVLLQRIMAKAVMEETAIQELCEEILPGE